MFILNCNITIGSYRFTRVNEVVIDKSNDLVTNTAIIKVPLSAVLKSQGEKTTIDIAKEIKPGMPITVVLAYKGVYSGEEFKGYVRRINYKIPLEIVCEDATYLLRKKNINKSWSSTNLKAVLEEIVSSTGIELAGNIPSVTMSPYSIKNADGAYALQKIKDDYGLTVYMNADGKLFAGLAYTDNAGTVKYSLNGEDSNVINPDDLKYHNQDDVRLKVKAINIHGNNTRTEVEVGDKDGSERTLFFYNIASLDELTKLAKEELRKIKFDGYEGKITTFLIPVAKPGMSAQITDDKFPDRAGTYYIGSVKTTFGQNGARREIEIGIRL